MGQYGNAAVRATEYYRQGKVQSILEAWHLAISEFSDSEPSRKKACPKDAYLGLCEAGLVLGIPAAKHGAPTNNKNGRYAVDAYWILRSEPSLSANKEALWNGIREPKAENENNQIDVVVSLWSKGLLASTEP